MSGAFEVAAGAFAVVGVADVLVRAGRDLYNFLCDIEDAPDNARRLCDGIAETILLASASRRCLLELETRTQSAPVVDVVDTLNSALKALDREVKSLKALTAKCKGSTKRWSNIRYALSEQRINKALSSLERSKLLLTNTLTLACRELTSIENQQVEKLIQQVVSKTVDLTQAVNARLDANEQSLATRLDALRQHDLATQTSHQHALNAKLDAHHQELTTAHTLHQESLTATRRAQMSAASSQTRLLRESVQANRRTALISRDVRAQARASEKQHQQTRDLFVATVRDLGIVQLRPAPKAANRQIMYSGEQRDLIVPALYSFKKELALVFDQLFTNHYHEVSPSHIAWLQSEFQNLVASAAQEEASSHPMSTATSFDTWLYSGGVSKSTRELEDQNPMVLTTYDTEQTRSVAAQKRRKRSHQILTFNTSKGTLQVRLPRRRTTTSAIDAFDEVGLSFVSASGEPFVALNAHFIQATDRFRASTICAQLHIFVPCEDEAWIGHDDLFMYGTIQDIDRALRDGIISPYQVNRQNPTLNLMFASAARFGRADILRYLESQGVGHSTLQQSFSVCSGTMFALDTVAGFDYKSMDTVLSGCADPAILLADMLMLCLSSCKRIFDSGYVYWSFISACLQRLHMANPINLYERATDPEKTERRLEMVPIIVRFLLETGADPNAAVLDGMSLVELFLVSALFTECITVAQGHSVRKQILSALIESGADILHRDRDGDTVADMAWAYDHWDPWCEALQENGLSVPEIDKSEEQGWALRANNPEEGDVDTETDEDLSLDISEDDISEVGTTEQETCTEAKILASD